MLTSMDSKDADFQPVVCGGYEPIHSRNEDDL